MTAMNLKTIRDHFISQSQLFPDYNQDYEKIINDVALAAKLIRTEIAKSSLSQQYSTGSTGNTNSSGEDVQGLDLYANDVIKNIFDTNQLFCCMASEEEEDVVLTRSYETSDYIILFDPLDGSSNIDVNVSIGTIFSIYRKSNRNLSPIDQCLQSGRHQLMAGYVLYGPATTLVYTTGQGVHEFTFDPSIGEFFVSQENITIPKKSKYYSINDSLYHKCTPEIQEFIEKLKSDGFSARYVGSLVADFHRNLLKGGIYLYPGTSTSPNGKLRLIYEANPLAFIAEVAGGGASTGESTILDLNPIELHQRVPLIIGSQDFLTDFFCIKNKETVILTT